MSYNDENEWQTVGGGNRRHNRNEDNSEEGAWRRKNDQEPERFDEYRQQGGSYGQRYQPDQEEFPSLGEEQRPNRRQSQADEQQSWRPAQAQQSISEGDSQSSLQPQRQSHSQAHKEDGESKFSMRGMFSALKKTVKEALKAKFHELTDDMRQNFKRPASEQHYAEPVSSQRVNLEPTRDELDDVRRAASKLWDLDLNRLTPGQDYEIDVGEGKKMYNKEDMAENALFRHLDPSVFKRQTYARFYALLDNYSADEKVSERITSQEQQEETAFIEEISRTAPVQYLQKYLAAKNIIQGGDQEFKKALHSLWFDLYNRGGTRNSSSAFEHVFVGEIKHGRNDNTAEVSGLHNWIQFYVEEAKGTLDYQGFILPRQRGEPMPDSQVQLLTVQFKWNGLLKPLSSTLVGVSPEFELALYTLCFFAGGEDNYVSLGPYSVNIKVYPLGRNCIGSAYPIAQE